MGKLSALTMSIGIFLVEVFATAQELPIEKHLPAISDDWVRRNDGSRGDHSWVKFDNRKVSGEVLSFVSWKVSPKMTVASSPIGQASIETFLSDGSASKSTSKRRQPISDTVRHHIISINVGSADLNRETDALEYTYIYESVVDSSVTMAHGYCIVIGETAIFVQHTSPKVISSELAFEMTGMLLSKHYEVAEGRPLPFSKG